MTQNEVSDDLPVFFKWGHTHTHNISYRFCWQYRHLRKDVVIPHWLHHHQAALLQQWRFRELWRAQELREYFKLVA